MAMPNCLPAGTGYISADNRRQVVVPVVQDDTPTLTAGAANCIDRLERPALNAVEYTFTFAQDPICETEGMARIVTGQAIV